MNKKILIGSIIAVAILILVSFTGVVGYQTTKSSTIARASPLFTVRSSRAIDVESKDIACDYVGKGEDILFIPRRNSKKVLIQNVIDRISKMDDETFNKLIFFTINKIKHSNNSNQKYIDELLTALPHIRENPKELENFINKDTNISLATPLTLSEFCKIFWTSLGNTRLGCIAWYYIFIFAFFLDIIIITPFVILAELATILHLEKLCFIAKTFVYCTGIPEYCFTIHIPC